MPAEKCKLLLEERYAHFGVIDDNIVGSTTDGACVSDEKSWKND
jgi:hypothetical protein